VCVYTEIERECIYILRESAYIYRERECVCEYIHIYIYRECVSIYRESV